MYWFRQSISHITPFVALFLVSWIGGWLLATHALRVRGRERLVAGLATGVVLYTALCNLLAYLVGSTWAFILAAVVVLGLGIISAWRSNAPWFHLSDLQAWPQMLSIFIIGTVFTLTLRGLAIWDDYHNLPIVSTMAAGNLPPKYYLDPSLPLSYHYGLHVFAASMAAMGGLTPWSAWDLARGFTTALAIVIAWLWFKRVTKSDLSAHFGATLLTFGGGTLWLLSLLPDRLLIWVSNHAPLANSAVASGPSLAANLSRPFRFEGGPFLQTPFSFLGSLFVPVTVNWNGTASLYLVCIFLLLLENERKRFSVIPILVSGLVLSLIALNAEEVYGLFLAGVLLILLVFAFWKWRRKKEFFHGMGRILATLTLSLVIVIFQGGVFTILFQNLFLGNSGKAVNGLGTAGFFFRWPPALIADYFQPLSIFNPAQIIVSLAEIGPAILLIPIVVIWVWKLGKRGHWIEAGLGLSGFLGFIIPFFIHYNVERDTTRITSYGLQTFLIVSVPALTLLLKQGKANVRNLIVGGFGLSIIGGIVTFAIFFTAITTPQLSYFIDIQDGRMSALGWNQIEPGSWILDRIPYRAVTLYGRPSRSSPASAPVDFSTYPEWRALIKNPNPSAVSAAGYRYIYMDNTWWNKLTLAQQGSLNQTCVRTIQKVGDVPSDDWRRLLDVSECK
ncbi:MAG: hypothetical protein WCE68_04585 [Anaerolineales bacterium]